MSGKTGLPDKPECTQVKNQRSMDLSDLKPGPRMGNRPFALILDPGQSGLIS